MIPKTTIENYTIRFAEEKDVPTILTFIKDLAEYEHLMSEVHATEELLLQYIFHEKKVEVIIGEYYNEPVGFALFFHNFSTFLAKPGLFLEDLYVNPTMRGKGFGKELIAYIARLVEERGYGRMEWNCLDWNEPSIRFYKSLGAKPMDEWTSYRLQRDITQ